MPDWVFPTIFVIIGLTVWIGMALRNTRRQIAATLARRSNPNREQFVSMMRQDVREDTAEFMWETIIFYLEPRLTPHPDDDLLNDLPIDDEEWSMDWPRDFAKRRGFDESAYPNWPKGVPPTVGNFARWLDLGERRAARRG